MRFFDGQVHWFEPVAIRVACFFAFAFRYALPVFAVVLLLAWPLLILQAIVEGLFIGLFLGIGKLWRPGKPPTPEPAPPPPRHGVAGYIWYSPLIALTLGYLKQYIDTGTWFL